MNCQKIRVRRFSCDKFRSKRGAPMPEKEPLTPKHGGYRKPKSFQIAQLVHDVAARFCDRYIEKH